MHILIGFQNYDKIIIYSACNFLEVCMCCVFQMLVLMSVGNIILTQKVFELEVLVALVHSNDCQQ